MRKVNMNEFIAQEREHIEESVYAEFLIFYGNFVLSHTAGEVYILEENLV